MTDLPKSPTFSVAAPLHYAAFRHIWLASLLSNIGILIRGVGANGLCDGDARLRSQQRRGTQHRQRPHGVYHRIPKDRRLPRPPLPQRPAGDAGKVVLSAPATNFAASSPGSENPYACSCSHHGLISVNRAL